MEVITFGHLFQVKEEFLSKSFPQYTLKFTFYKHIALKIYYFFRKFFMAAHFKTQKYVALIWLSLKKYASSQYFPNGFGKCNASWGMVLN